MSHALNVSSVALLKLLEFKYYQCRILPCLPLSGHYIGYTSQLWLIHQLNWLWLTCGAYYEHVNMKLDEFGLANLQKWTNLHLNISKLEKRHALKTNLWPVLPLKHLCYSLQNKACSPLKLGVLNSRQSETCFFPETNILSHTAFMIQLQKLFEIYQSWKLEDNLFKETCILPLIDDCVKYQPVSSLIQTWYYLKLYQWFIHN